jgi:general secretion pathway protein G
MRRTIHRTTAGGFTLVELVAVLGIVALLVAMAWPLAEVTARRERERELKEALWQIRDAIDAYKRMADAGLIAAPPSGYPPNLQVLVDGVPTSGSGRTYFLRRLPDDPFAEPGAPDGGWALRSYRSPADRPEPGDDVFDVHSSTTLSALDGTPLNRW